MENSLTYTMNGDYQIPDLKLTEQPEKPLGKYGRMRKAYLKEHRPILYNQLLMSEKLYPHLLEIDETAQSRLEQLMPQLAKDAGATEQLKASDPMRWVGLMNTCKAQAEEISVKVSTGSAQIKGHTEPALPTSKFSGQNGRMTKTVRRNQGQLGLAL